MGPRGAARARDVLDQIGTDGDLYGLFSHGRSQRVDLVSRVLELDAGRTALILVERSMCHSRVIEQWEMTSDRCMMCRREGLVVRLTCAAGHDRLQVDSTGYRCISCAQKEIWELKHQGIEVHADRNLLQVLHEAAAERGRRPKRKRALVASR